MSTSHHCSVCGAEAQGGSGADDHLYCPTHPKATIETIVSRAGGPTATEARRAELGRVRLHVRIRAESLARLDALCAESGYTRPEQIEALIDCESVTAKR